MPDVPFICVDGIRQWLSVARHLSLLAPCMAPWILLASLMFGWAKTVSIELSLSRRLLPARATLTPRFMPRCPCHGQSVGRSPAGRASSMGLPGFPESLNGVGAAEVQFHTRPSYEAWQLTHPAYERLRHPHTSDAERADLNVFRRKVYSIFRPEPASRPGGPADGRSGKGHLLRDR